MQYFLEGIAKKILQDYRDISGEICIVTPNQRAGLFLRKHLAAHVNEVMWAPEILSIEDFVNKLSSYTVVDKMTMLLEFYGVYKSMEQDNADDLDAFLSWAPTLLSDFDDVDSALADRGKLYEYLTDIRYIDTWNPDGSPLTEFQKKYLAFIEKLGDFHNALADHLKKKGMAWQALSTRLVAKLLNHDEEDQLPWKKVIFAGFNALTPAEESIINTLLKKGKADYIIDSDPFYADDPEHEAGRFIRKYKNKFNVQPTEDPGNGFADKAKKIRIMGIAKNVNQARLAGNLLLEADKLPADETTAVVLASENLLIPMLNALPGDVKDVNVTMGYPLNKTNMYRFFDSLFHLFLHGMHVEKDGSIRYYHKDLHRFFSHGISALLWNPGSGRELTNKLMQEVAASNMSFCTFTQLAEATGVGENFSTSFDFINQNWQQEISGLPDAMLELSRKIDTLLRKKAAEHGGDIVQSPYFVDFESLYYFARIFRKLSAFLQDYAYLSSLKIVYRLFRQAASETRLSFAGEPLQGLQVMGMLETRSLDFKNVVLLSANENILPKPANVQSFIPFEVKKAFGLRIHHEQDAIFAYHFYRLLQRAENVYLIYNTQTEDIGSSEKSRFITQIQYELPAYNPNTQISEEIVSIPPQKGHAPVEISIEKTSDIIKRLHDIARKGFSPSALSRYINCPLQFYFEKVVSIREADAVEETMEATTIGSVVHHVLETLYRPYIGKILQKKDIQEMRGKLHQALQEAFSSEYKGGNVLAGKNLLLYHLIKRYAENMLAAETAFIEQAGKENKLITVIDLEKPLQADILVDADFIDEDVVRIKGMADRIDRLGNVLRVIDYKTGKTEPKELKFKEWSEPFVDTVKGKSFQLLCYAWLCHKAFPAESLFEPGIISTRNPGRGSQTIDYPGGSAVLPADQMHLIEEHLRKLACEIMDPSLPFSQTQEEDNCKYCNFKLVCARH